MLLLIGKDKKIKNIIEEARFSDLGIWERKHLEDWILEHPEILGEDLMVVTTEYDKFDKTKGRLDILAIDKNGKLVIIELKRDTADKYADLQAIHYAAYCANINMEQVVDMMEAYLKQRNKQALSKEELEEKIRDFIENEDFSDFDNNPRIILAANDFREETLASILWLRDNGIDITCVKLEAYLIGEDIAVKPEILIPLPEAKDFIIQVEQKKKKSSELTPRQKEFYEFWSKLMEKFNEAKPGITQRKPSTIFYQQIPAGHSNVHFEWFIYKRTQGPLRPGFYVALHFEYSDYEENKALLAYFQSREDVIRKKFPDIVFLDKWREKYAQIYLWKSDFRLNEENLNWGKEKMIEFYDFFKPLLDEYFNRSLNKGK